MFKCIARSDRASVVETVHTRNELVDGLFLAEKDAWRVRVAEVGIAFKVTSRSQHSADVVITLVRVS